MKLVAQEMSQEAVAMCHIELSLRTTKSTLFGFDFYGLMTWSVADPAGLFRPMLLER